MIPLISSIIIGIASAELIYFGVMRKRIVKHTEKEGLNYTFRDFLIEKSFAMLIGLGSGMLSYDIINNYMEVTRFIISAFVRLAIPVLILMFLVLMLLVNWLFSLKLEKKGN